MMLPFSDNDGVARLDEGLAETVRHGIDGRRTAGSKDDFFPGARVDERPRRFPRLLVGIRRLSRQLMHRPIDIGVALL